MDSRLEFTRKSAGNNEAGVERVISGPKNISTPRALKGTRTCHNIAAATPIRRLEDNVILCDLYINKYNISGFLRETLLKNIVFLRNLNWLQRKWKLLMTSCLLWHSPHKLRHSIVNVRFWSYILVKKKTTSLYNFYSFD